VGLLERLAVGVVVLSERVSFLSSSPFVLSFSFPFPFHIFFSSFLPFLAISLDLFFFFSVKLLFTHLSPCISFCYFLLLLLFHFIPKFSYVIGVMSIYQAGNIILRIYPD
jgi:hypothetical protein